LDQLDIYQKYFWYLSKIVLANDATFEDDNLLFTLHKNPFPEPITTGKYTLDKSKLDGAFFYRLNHTL